MLRSRARIDQEGEEVEEVRDVEERRVRNARWLHKNGGSLRSEQLKPAREARESRSLRKGNGKRSIEEPSSK